MKPARFILNSDYTTVRNTGHKEVSVTIPNDFTAPYSPSGTRYIIGRVSVTLGDASDSFSIYYSSDKFNYISPSLDYGYTIPEGSKTHSDTYGDSHEDISFNTKVNGNTATFEVSCLNPYPQGGLRFIGYGQTITAHILTFKDPFSK